MFNNHELPLYIKDVCDWEESIYHSGEQIVVVHLFRSSTGQKI